MSTKAPSDETELRDILCLGNQSRRVGLRFSSMIKARVLSKIVTDLFKAKGDANKQELVMLSKQEVEAVSNQKIQAYYRVITTRDGHQKLFVMSTVS